ncbi:MAG: hypothetical protein R3E77_01950 [Steroidobacteraceae bacterium]
MDTAQLDFDFAWFGADWDGATLSVASLTPLREINEELLQLLAGTAARDGTAADDARGALVQLLRPLDDAARERLAQWPYALVEAGFHDSLRWGRLLDGGAGDLARSGAAWLASGERSNRFARMVLNYAWHLARSRPLAARVVFGMSAESVLNLRSVGIARLERAALASVSALRPRWPGRLDWWRQAAHAAGSADPQLLSRAKLNGLQMLAGDLLASGTAGMLR